MKKRLVLTALLITCLAAPALANPLSRLPSFPRGRQKQPDSAPAAAPSPDTNATMYSESNPPDKSLDQVMADAKSSVSNAKDARELKQEVDRLLRGAAGNVHASALMQVRICNGLNQYLQALEKVAALEMKEEVSYSEMELKLNKAMDQTAPITEIKTVITADLQGSQVSAGKMIEQLDNYKNHREAIQRQAQPSYELFLKTGASLSVVDKNYKHALITGEVTTEAVGNKLNQLQTKAVAETAVTTGLIGALVYYSADINRKMNKSSRSGSNPLAALGGALKQQAQLEASKLAIDAMTKDLQKTKQEYQDLKVFAEQARGLLDEIHKQGPALREQNQKISKVLAELTDVARESLTARAATDKEVERFVTAQNNNAEKLVAADKIPVFAE